MYCRHCGNKLPDDSRFCVYCGKSVVIEGPAPSFDDGEASDAQGRADELGHAEEPGRTEEASSTDGDSSQALSTDESAAPWDASGLDKGAASQSPLADGDAAPSGPSDLGGTEGAERAGTAVPPGTAPVPTAPPTDGRQASPSRRWIPVAIAVVAIAAIGIGVFAYQRAEAERIAQEERVEREREAAARERRLQLHHDVRIGVSASGWDTDDGGTPLPMEINGTTVAGDIFEEIQFVDSAGDGISLVPGTYEASVAASPFAKYGRMYDYPSDSLTIEVDDDLEEGEGIDLSDEIEIELTYPDGLSASRIERAREIALEAGYDAADGLADKAYERYFDDGEGRPDSSSSDLTGSFSSSNPLASSSDSGAQTYSGDFFEIDLPSTWEINVASGGGDVLARHFVKVDGETIMTIDVMHGDTSVSGSIDGAGGKEKLGTTSDGFAVVATRGNSANTSDNMDRIVQALDTIDIY